MDKANVIKRKGAIKIIGQILRQRSFIDKNW